MYKNKLFIVFLISFVSLIAFSTTIDAHSLGFSILTNVSMVPTFKGFYSNATPPDVLLDDCWCNNPLLPYLSYWNQPQPFSRMILANNISELNSYMLVLSKQYNFSSSDYVGYDSEDWALTPLSEQKSIVASTQVACDAVHSAGYLFAFTPEVDVPGWYGLTDFSQINWTCVNFLDLQEQSHSTDPKVLTQNVTELISMTTANNHNLTVFVQLDVAGDSSSASQSRLEQDISNLSQIQGVQGVILQDLCNSPSCNAILEALVAYTDSFENNTTVLANSTAQNVIQATTSTSTTTVTTTAQSTTVPTTTSTTTSTTSTTTSSTTTSSTTIATTTTSTSVTSTSTSTTTTVIPLNQTLDNITIQHNDSINDSANSTVLPIEYPFYRHWRDWFNNLFKQDWKV